MSELEQTTDKGTGELVEKLHTYFDGKIVRKDLTKKIKEGANVPVYVLEYLLGMYCSSRNEDEIAAGVYNVKQILAENYVRPDEAQKIISKLREKGSYTIIDKISVKLNYHSDVYEAEFSNLGCRFSAKLTASLSPPLSLESYRHPATLLRMLPTVIPCNKRISWKTPPLNSHCSRICCDI